MEKGQGTAGFSQGYSIFDGIAPNATSIPVEMNPVARTLGIQLTVKCLDELLIIIEELIDGNLLMNVIEFDHDQYDLGLGG